MPRAHAGGNLSAKIQKNSNFFFIKKTCILLLSNSNMKYSQESTKIPFLFEKMNLISEDKKNLENDVINIKEEGSLLS